ncbi:hypothetical protein ANTPLA_LOCUS7458 [Anthophora plagiata]
MNDIYVCSSMNTSCYIMKKFYFSLVAVIMVTACVASTIRPVCKELAGCPSQNNDTYTVHLPCEDDCHKFYKCNKKCGYLMDCPVIAGTEERLVFNPELQVCDWPIKSGGCSHTPAGTTKTSETTSTTTMSPTEPDTIVDCDLLEKCPKTMTKLMVHDTDCHKFYICMKGQIFSSNCEDKQIFNPETRECDDPANTKCYITKGCEL